MTQASEYGGVPGNIQPEPHQLTASEQARLERRVDSADPGDSVDAAREREVTGEPDPGGRSSH
jgi:hypothetical protein